MEITLQDLMYRLNDETSDHPAQDDEYPDSYDCLCDFCVAHRVLLALLTDMREGK